MIGIYKCDSGFASYLPKLQYKPQGKEYITLNDQILSKPTIGDTRTSYKICETFANNIKTPVSVIG